MKKAILYIILLTIKYVSGQNINKTDFFIACDSMAYYDIVSNYSFEINETEKKILKEQYIRYNKIVAEYSKKNLKDSTIIAITIMNSHIKNANYFKSNNLYYLALRACDKTVDILMKLTSKERSAYWNPYLSEIHYNRFLVYYNIFKIVGFSTGANEILFGELDNTIKEIDKVSSHELTQIFLLFTESDLRKKMTEKSLDSIYSLFCKQILKRNNTGNITNVQFYLSGKILLEHLNSKGKLNCNYDFNKTFYKITNEIETKKIRMSEGAFYFEPYLKWKLINNNEIDDKSKNYEIDNILKALIKTGAYNSFDDIYMEMAYTYYNTKTLDFYPLQDVKKELDNILFYSRNFTNAIIESNIIYNIGLQSNICANYTTNSKYKIDYNKFIFDNLNLFDFDEIDKVVLKKIKNHTELSELSYFSVFEYEIRKQIQENTIFKYIGIDDLRSALKLDESFIYSMYIDLNYGNNITNSGTYKAKNAQCLLIVTKNKQPQIFILDDHLETSTLSSFNITKKVIIPISVKNALIGIRKIYTYNDPWPWLLLNTDGNYMCHSYEFHKITSLKEITNKNEQQTTNNDMRAIIFSNPDYSYSAEYINPNKQPNTTRSSYNDVYYFNSNKNEKITLNNLPNTEFEAKKILEILNKNNIKTIWHNEKQAKEQYIYDHTSPYILHFATHGIQLNKDSLDKAFLFYNALTFCNATNAINNGYSGFIADKQDGLLTGLEILNLNLSSTDLVVLSACETGKGTAENWINGTYYNSLQRAFRLAGAKAVLASKWKVPDKQTQELMVEFYTNWLEKKMTKHKALQQAQLTMSKKYPEPYYWAAWVLYGE